MKKTAGKCRSCKGADGSHTKGCSRKPCIFCARFAPKKCKWHGGPSRSATDLANTGKKPRSPSVNGLAAGIARLKAMIAAGRAAEAELAAIRKALA